ncbi:hypothetical protein [Actinoplanes sp. NPDC026670]|uniref:hypothetical protein n=1 Tax=Actinoplanes sp. NPDC026670 TaxID=3154700 RepID=UPI0033E065D1
MNMHSTREFDAFGPWIDEVRTADDLPRLYRNAGLDPATCRLVLKVPRDIERRNANPGMHLYDYLLALDDETLTVLWRTGDTFDRVSLPLDRVAAIEDSVRLLNGRLTVHVVDGSAYTVAYNGSASGPIRDLIRELRLRCLPATPSVVADDLGVPAEPRLGRDDTGLLTDYHRLIGSEPGLRLINASERRVVVPHAAAERLYRRVWPITLHASILVADDREIQVIHRRDWFTPAGDDLSLARTVLPRARITGLTARPHGRYRDVHVVTAQAGAVELHFPMAAGPFTTTLLS